MRFRHFNSNEFDRRIEADIRRMEDRVRSESVAHAEEIIHQPDFEAVGEIVGVMRYHGMRHEGPAARHLAHVWLTFLRGLGPPPEFRGVDRHALNQPHHHAIKRVAAVSVIEKAASTAMGTETGIPFAWDGTSSLGLVAHSAWLRFSPKLSVRLFQPQHSRWRYYAPIVGVRRLPDPLLGGTLGSECGL